GPPPQPGQQFKFTINESCDRIKEEFNFLQTQYHGVLSSSFTCDDDDDDDDIIKNHHHHN
ncbi:hypothetical protein BLA29_013767, partial [Euroglyphus maynei]